MGRIAMENFEQAAHLFFGGKLKNEEPYEALKHREELIDELERKITEYLVNVSEKRLTQEHYNESVVLLNTITDLERIGDHADSISDRAKYVNEHKIIMSDEAAHNLLSMVTVAHNTLNTALQALEHNDVAMAIKTIEHEFKLNELEKEYRNDHIVRLNEKTCMGEPGAVFLDMLNDLTRIGDHAVNIAEYVMESNEEERKKKS
jgi:phosphate:Na+ symporter